MGERLNKSATIAELGKALIKAQAEFPLIEKTKEVIVQGQKGSYTFKYAPLEKTLPTVRPILAKHGLGFTQGGDGETLVTLLFHESGEWIEFNVPCRDQGANQQYGAQFTYRRRYSLEGALGIKTDDDDGDRDLGTQERKTRATPNHGALNNVAKDRLAWINDQASSIIDSFNADQPDSAHKIWKEVTDNEEKLAVWSFLDSKMRRELKKRDANGQVSA
jgi:hypothetical protein